MHLDVSVASCRGVPTSPCSEPGSADIESMEAVWRDAGDGHRIYFVPTLVYLAYAPG